MALVTLGTRGTRDRLSPVRSLECVCGGGVCACVCVCVLAAVGRRRRCVGARGVCVCVCVCCNGNVDGVWCVRYGNG